MASLTRQSAIEYHLPSSPLMELPDAAEQLKAFSGDSLRHTIGDLERSLSGAPVDQLTSRIPTINNELLKAAVTLKQVAGQVNVLIHAIGILLSLPHILDDGEVVEALSLGAGNTGRAFDLVTDKRIAEFKFIQWRGGAESIRQNSIFKDFFELAEADTPKRKILYVLGLEHPMKFFEGGRALSSVLSKNQKVRDAFEATYGQQFVRVSEYYEHRKGQVEILDLAAEVPGIDAIFGA